MEPRSLSNAYTTKTTASAWGWPSRAPCQRPRGELRASNRAGGGAHSSSRCRPASSGASVRRLPRWVRRDVIPIRKVSVDSFVFRYTVPTFASAASFWPARLRWGVMLSDVRLPGLNGPISSNAASAAHEIHLFITGHATSRISGRPKAGAATPHQPSRARTSSSDSAGGHAGHDDIVRGAHRRDPEASEAAHSARKPVFALVVTHAPAGVSGVGVGERRQGASSRVMEKMRAGSRPCSLLAGGGGIIAPA